MPGEHAKLSPSSSARWLTCTASPGVEAQFPDEASSYAEEGTLAHELGELLLTKHFTKMRKSTFDKKLEAISHDVLYAPEMLEHATSYRDFVSEQYNAMPLGTLVEIEKRVDLSEIVPDGFGRCDCVLISNEILHVIDLKYGKGVAVDAENNTQLKLYALGALLLFEQVYDIETVRASIYQPRIDNIGTVEMSADALRDWGEFVKPIAKEAAEGPGVFRPTEDGCRFCKARAVCTARADFNLELAKYDFAKPELLPESDIADILTRLKEFEQWATDVKEYALDQAVNCGVEYPGWKLVEGRSNRVYTDEAKALEALTAGGYDRDIVTKILGITALEKAVGKKTVGSLLADLIIKPQGKPTLAPLSDKRPAISSVQEAINDFKED